MLSPPWMKGATVADFKALKEERPIRFLVAVAVFRVIWWPFIGLCLPFALIGGVVDWLSWTALPAVARLFQPIGAAVHSGALKVGNAILGYTEQPQ